MKILAAIASFGTKNDSYLARLIEEYRSMSFDVDVVVLSNLQKPVGLGAKVSIVDLAGKNPGSLPFAHKQIFADRLNDYDLFIYSEDDTLITEANLQAYLKACSVLEENEIPGFFRFERGADGGINYPEVHGPFHWSSRSARRRGGNIYASFTNEHSACYVLTRDQLRRAIASGGFLVEPHRGRYDLICTAATDPYTQCGFEKVIGVSPLSDFLVHHLPNVYVGSTFGIGESELRGQLDYLLQIVQNGHRGVPLFSTATKIMAGRFSKDCYERAQQAVVESVPQGARLVLSIGSACAATESSLIKKGMRVVAMPVDPVFSATARAKGIEIVEGDPEAVREKLHGQQFDCILLLDVLHLTRDPVDVLSSFAPFLRKGGTAIVQVPVVKRFATAYRAFRGDQRFGELGTYETTGVHFISRRIVRRWLAKAGLRTTRVATELPAAKTRFQRSLQWLSPSLLARQMGARIIFTATKR